MINLQNKENLIYKPDPLDWNVVGVYVAEYPLNPAKCYFEVEIVTIGSKGHMAVGLCSNRCMLDDHVGHFEGSIGIMACDGSIFKNGCVLQRFKDKCKPGDKIGVGIKFGNLLPGEDILHSLVHVFFAKNGKEIISCRVRLLEGGLLPAVSMESEEEQVKLSLGLNWIPEEDTLMDVDSVEDDWYCLHDVRLNGQVLEYIGHGETILDVGLAQAKTPLNTQSHYFEIEITDPGENCFIAIGLTEKNYPKNRLPGWDKGSIAYHADDGKVFIGCGVGEVFGPKCHKGDTMGCGIFFPQNYEVNGYGANDTSGSSSCDDETAYSDSESATHEPQKQSSRFVEVFFTRNGKMVGMRRVKVPSGGFLPSVGMLSFSEKVKVNLKPLTG